MVHFRSFQLLIGCLVMSLLAAGPQVSAEEPAAPQDTAVPALANDQAFAVIAIDLDWPGNPNPLQAFLEAISSESDDGSVAHQLLKALAVLNPRSFHVPATDAAAAEKPREAARPHAANGVKQIYLVAASSDLMRLFSSPRQKQKIDVPLFLVVPGAGEETIKQLRALLPAPSKNPQNQTGVMSAGRQLQADVVVADPRLFDRLTAARPEFAAALAAAGKLPVRIAVAPPPLFARAATEIVLSPAPGTDRPLGQYLAEIRSVSLGVDPTAESARLQMQIMQSPTGGRERMLDLIKDLASMVDTQLAKDSKQQFPSEGPPPKMPPAKIEGDTIVWTLDEPFKWLVAHVPTAKAAAEVMKDRNRLRQIAISLQNYHDGHKRFPDVAIRDRQGKPLLSWRVAILPFFGRDDLYKQFHLDEPWDSQHNRTLIDQMPDLFRGVGTAKGRTRYLAPVGENLAFTPQPGGLNMKTFTDGTGKTILVVEADADHAVIWTKPEDLVVDPENPKRGITDGETNFVVVLVSASTYDFKGSIRPEVLRAMFTRNGEELYNIDDIYPAE
ncbi:MAG TPA: DUF1559 domain-containing protein [Pirellulales bacterium]